MPFSFRYSPHYAGRSVELSLGSATFNPPFSLTSIVLHKQSGVAYRELESTHRVQISANAVRYLKTYRSKNVHPQLSVRI